MLKIVKADEPIKVDNINLAVYGPPGTGKTTLANSAERAINLDFDRGAYRAGIRVDTVEVNSWNDVVGLTAQDLQPYATIVVDTAGRALDRLSEDIIADNPKLGRGSALTLQGFGVLKVRFASFLKFLNSQGKDVVLVCHMDEQRAGDEIVERLDVQGGSKAEIYKSVDAMGRIFVNASLQRVIDFSPRANSFGKNPAAFPLLPIPSPDANKHFLADVIKSIKTKLNQMSEEQVAIQAANEDWVTALADFSTADDFNRNLEEIRKTSKAVQTKFAKRAKELGFVYDKARKLYLEGVNA